MQIQLQMFLEVLSWKGTGDGFYCQMSQDCKSKPDLKAQKQRNIFIVSSIEWHHENKWFKKYIIFFLNFVTLIVFITKTPNFLIVFVKDPHFLIVFVKDPHFPDWIFDIPNNVKHVIYIKVILCASEHICSIVRYCFRSFKQL